MLKLNIDIDRLNRNRKKLLRDPKLFIRDVAKKRLTKVSSFKLVEKLIDDSNETEDQGKAIQDRGLASLNQVNKPALAPKKTSTVSAIKNTVPLDLTHYNNQMYQFTKRYNVNSIKIGEEFIWPYLRNHMLVNLYATWRGRVNYKQMNPLALSTAHFSKIGKYTRDYSIQSIGAKPFDTLKNESTNILFICQHSGFGRTNIEGNIYHRLIDPLYEAAVSITSCKKVEFISNPNTDFIDMWHDYKYKTLSILPPDYQKVGYYHKCTYDETIFINYKGLFKTQTPLNRHILNSVIDYELHSREWMLEVLKQLKPKIIFLTSFHYHAALISAAHELGILTIDIQHGLQVGDGILYNHHEEIPSKGYQAYPDYFAVWGDKEKKGIEKNFPSAKHKAILMGNPWLNMLDRFEYNFPDKIHKKLMNDKRLIGLIILKDQEDIQAIYKDIIKETKDDVLWLVRHHPTARKLFSSTDFISGLINDSVLIDKSIDEANLRALFKFVDLTLSEGSALAYEASQYGIKNFVFSDYAADNFADEIKTDSFYYIDSTEDFLRLYSEVDFSNKSNSWLPFAEVDINEFIKKVLKLADKKQPAGTPFLFNNEVTIKEFQETVEHELKSIKDSLSNGETIKAVETYYNLRSLLGTAPKVDELCATEHEYFAKESRIFKNIINKEFDIKDHNVVMVSDSLGLPRPHETAREDFGAKTTTAWFFNSNELAVLNDRKMMVWAQRYLTTERLLKDWSNIVGNLNNKHLVIHLGLNDSSERIFLEEQRLAMDILKPETKKEIIQFGRDCRREIISNQFEYNYVNPVLFRKNLEEIVSRAKSNNVASISFVNIISFPKSHEINTPRSLANTLKYNTIIEEVVKSNQNVSLIDIENIFISEGKTQCMLEDNMHLSPRGHEILANEIHQKLSKTVRSEFNLALIGVGQLGSRYLQGLKKVQLGNVIINLQLVEKDTRARKTAIERYDEIQGFGSSRLNLEFCEDISQLHNKLDLVIISTAADVRAEILRELLLQKTVQNLVLEKVLFQKPEDYSEFKSKFDDLKINVWVNHPRREFEFYKNLVSDISSSNYINFNVSGSNWGLACNSLHFLDLVLFLQKQSTHIPESIDLNLSVSQVVPAKRQGCYEVIGNLSGNIGKANINFDCRSSEDNAVTTVLNINTDSIRLSIDELSGAVSYATAINNWAWQHEIINIIEFQSDLTPKLVEDILISGRCNLPSYEEACFLHEPFINLILSALKTEVDETINTCLIS